MTFSKTIKSIIIASTFCFAWINAHAAQSAVKQTIATVYDYNTKKASHHLSVVKMGATIAENKLVNYIDFDGEPDAFIGGVNGFYTAFGPGVYSYEFMNQGQNCDVQEVPFRLNGHDAVVCDLAQTPENSLCLFSDNTLIDIEHHPLGKFRYTHLPLGSHPKIYTHKNHSFFPHTSDGSILRVAPGCISQTVYTSNQSLSFKDFIATENRAYALYEKALRSFSINPEGGMSLLNESRTDTIYTHLVSINKNLYALNSTCVAHHTLNESGVPIDGNKHSFAGPQPFNKIFQSADHIFLCSDNTTYSFSVKNVEHGTPIMPKLRLPTGGKVLGIEECIV